MKKLPNFSHEQFVVKNGFYKIAGIDEVGRGSFAGPVVCGAVVFNKSQIINDEIPSNIIINDSKKLSAKQREISAKWICENALTFGIGQSTVSEINRLGIVKATNKAFRRAICNVNKRLQSIDYGPLSIDYLLVDAFYIPYVKGLRRKNQSAIIKGDTKSISIAAASIVAKVYRDKYMEGISRDYTSYFWNKNKGYGTKVHREAILKYGLTKHHRKTFVETFLRNKNYLFSFAGANQAK